MTALQNLGERLDIPTSIRCGTTESLGSHGFFTFFLFPLERTFYLTSSNVRLSMSSVQIEQHPPDVPACSNAHR